MNRSPATLLDGRRARRRWLHPYQARLYAAYLVLCVAIIAVGYAMTFALVHRVLGLR